MLGLPVELQLYVLSELPVKDLQHARAVCTQLRGTIDDPANLRAILDSRHSRACAALRATSDAVANVMGTKADYLQKVVCADKLRGLSEERTWGAQDLSRGARALLRQLLEDQMNHLEGPERPQCCVLATALFGLHFRRPHRDAPRGMPAIPEIRTLDHFYSMVSNDCSMELLEEAFGVREADLEQFYTLVRDGDAFPPTPVEMDDYQLALTLMWYQKYRPDQSPDDISALAALLDVPVILKELTYCVRTSSIWDIAKRTMDTGEKPSLLQRGLIVDELFVY